MKPNRFFQTLVLGLTGILLSLLVLVAASPSPAQSPARVIEWKMQTVYPAADSSTPCISQRIVNTLNERLKGKLHITLFLPGQIVPESEMFDALKKGVFESAYMAPTWYQNFIPDGIVGFGLPLGWQGYDMAMEFFYKYGFIKHMRAIHAEQNVFYVGPTTLGMSLFGGNFPFRKLEDIKGKKMWAIGPNGAYLRNMGGVPVTFPLSELYMALKLGTVEGLSMVLSDLETEGFKEVIKYLNFPLNVNPTMAGWLVNLKTWNDLPEDVKKTIEDTMTELQPVIWKCIEDLCMKGVEAAKRGGVQIITMEPNEAQRLRPYAKQVWLDVAKRSERAPKTVKMLEDFLATKGIKME